MPTDKIDPAVMSSILKYTWLILTAPVLWCVKQINDLKADHYETKIHAASTYVKNDEYREDIKQLNQKMDRLLEKLEHKADR